MKFLVYPTFFQLHVFSFMIFLSCSPSPQGIDRTVVDDLGHRVRIKREVKKIVSLVPTNSEMVCLLDCSRLVGGTRYDQFPEKLALRIREKQVAVIGGAFFDANLEKIVQLEPDLILANGPSQQKFVLPLKRMGYPVVSLWPQDLDGLKRDFSLLGEILDQGAKAKGILAEIERGFGDIKKRVSRQKRKRVYFQTWPDPLITIGKASFSHWLLTAAGGINVFGDMPFDSGQINMEWIIQRDPEVLIFIARQREFVRKLFARPEWKSIRGVQRSHICFVDEADIRRSIQFLEGLAKIHACLSGTEQTGQGEPEGGPK